MRFSQDSLAAKNFRMPAEWESQEATILTWPHNLETWPTQLDAVRLAYVNYIREIVDHQDVWLLVLSEDARINVERLLTLHCVSLNRIRFLQVPTFDSWVRDYGPIFVVCGDGKTRERMATNWVFNAWGGKYSELYSLDAKAGHKISHLAKQEHELIDFVLEGGSIDVNGRGTLMTSTNCLLHESRNAAFSQDCIEQVLADNLGVTSFIWVEGEITGDDTNGHIDDAVRFVSPDTVVCIDEPNTNDENHRGIQQLQASLRRSFVDGSKPLVMSKLPMPAPLYSDEERGRLPASYANFLITNEKVLVPTFRCAQDKIALAILAEHFTSRKVVGIDAVDLVYGLGSLHCLSMQVPK